MKPRFILSKRKLKEQYDSIREKCDIIAYSMKTNLIVGELLQEMTDCWISIHFKYNLVKVKDKSRVLFFAQGWTKEDIEEVYSMGVNKFVVDNENDLITLLNSIEGKKITLFLRIKMKEFTVHTGKYFVFGISSKRANEIISELKDHPNIGALGIHFHRKTQNIHEWAMQYELKDSLTEETVKTIKYVNMGGGIPVPYKNSRADRQEHVFNEIKKLKDWLKDTKLIIEPGRFLAAPCIKLKALIINVYDNNVIINCSVYNAAMDTFIANVRLEIEEEKEKGTPYTIKGNTPDSLDIFRYQAFLDNPKVGDTLTFINAGAYNFNSKFFNLGEIETVIEE